MNSKKAENHLNSKLLTDAQVRIDTIMKIQSLPSEIVVKLIQAKGSLRKDKKGSLRIVKKAK